MNKQQLDDAWLNMQERLKQEPESAKWTAFAERARHGAESAAERRPEPDAARKEAEEAAPRLSAPSASQDRAAAGAWPERLRRRKRWIAGAAAALTLGLALATPAGNRVLASLLSEFRMEQLTVVEERDLESLFHSIGVSESTINQYGEFAHSTEGEYATYASIEELQEQTDRELVIPAMFRDGDRRNLHIGVTPSRTITMKMNVTNINDTMRELGAEKLFPSSIDGKRITLTVGHAVRLELYDDQTQAAYSFTQRPVPTVAVEAGVPVAEALETVLQFPLLPAELKQELEQSHVLASGSAPLPVVMPDGYERMRIAGTEVLVLNADHGHSSAAWVSDGRLFTFSGAFEGRDDWTAMLTELIGS